MFLTKFMTNLILIYCVITTNAMGSTPSLF